MQGDMIGIKEMRKESPTIEHQRQSDCLHSNKLSSISISVSKNFESDKLLIIIFRLTVLRRAIYLYYFQKITQYASLYCV